MQFAINIRKRLERIVVNIHEFFTHFTDIVSTIRKQQSLQFEISKNLSYLINQFISQVPLSSSTKVTLSLRTITIPSTLFTYNTSPDKNKT